MKEGAVARTVSVVFLFHLSPSSMLRLLLWPQSMATALRLFLSFFPNCSLAGWKLHTLIGMKRKTKWHLARLLLAFFYPTSNTLFTVVFLCPWLFWRKCMLRFLFYLLFVWHLAGVPQGEVHSVAVARIKGYQALNHYINRWTSDCILLCWGSFCVCCCFFKGFFFFVVLKYTVPFN